MIFPRKAASRAHHRRPISASKATGFSRHGLQRATYLTRAGNFTPSASGDLVNAAGFTLLGYSVASGSTSADGISALQPVNVTGDGLKAVASTTGTYTANLNSDATAVTGVLPSANLAASTYTSKSRLVTYDNLGNVVTLDIYSTKTGANTWEQSIYNGADAAPRRLSLFDCGSARKR